MATIGDDIDTAVMTPRLRALNANMPLSETRAALMLAPSRADA